MSRPAPAERFTPGRDGQITGTAVGSRPPGPAARDWRRARYRAGTVFAVLWLAVYLVGGTIAAATGHAAGAAIGLAVGGFFTLLNLTAALRRRRAARRAGPSQAAGPRSSPAP